MHLPRRYRRKLFFPPGLVALALLLLMGCMQISGDARLEPKTILPLNLLPTFPSAQMRKDFKNALPFLSERQIRQFCNWDELALNGHKFHDSTALVTANRLIAGYQQYAMHRRGIRIEFSNEAHYASLIEVLNIMQRHNVKTYWFNLQHTPTIFYAYTEEGSSLSTFR